MINLPKKPTDKITTLSVEQQLSVVYNRAATELIQINNSGLSVKAIKVRLDRIADDLKFAISDEYLTE